ncbi:hypothetical protein E0K89_021165 [Aquicoccus sp. SCR17]|nr:hypothetical protein [Carideicomes alvinocaridis]
MPEAPHHPRRRPDGSIDTAHYMARGRRMRAEAACDIARALTRAGQPESPRPRPFLRFRLFGALRLFGAR